MSQSLAFVLILLAAAVFFAAAVAFGYLYIATKLNVSREVQAQVNQWTNTERENIQQQEQKLANTQAELRFEQWN